MGINVYIFIQDQKLLRTVLCFTMKESNQIYSRIKKNSDLDVIFDKKNLNPQPTWLM